jgi:hypothetical protein
LNDLLATLSAIVGIASPLLTLLVFLVIKRRIMDEAAEIVDETIERGKVFYAAEKKDFSESLPILAQNLLSPILGNGLSQKMSELGQASGISRSMKGLERDLIADGVDQVAPGFGGLAAKYIQKYPMLLPLIQQLGPMFAKPKGAESTSVVQASNW